MIIPLVLSDQAASEVMKQNARTNKTENRRDTPRSFCISYFYHFWPVLSKQKNFPDGKRPSCKASFLFSDIAIMLAGTALVIGYRIMRRLTKNLTEEAEQVISDSDAERAGNVV